MTDQDKGIVRSLRRWATELKSPTLLFVVGGLFLIDLLIFDAIPFVDEIILGILTILIARWKTRRVEPAAAPKPPPKNVTPEG